MISSNLYEAPNDEAMAEFVMTLASFRFGSIPASAARSYDAALPSLADITSTCWIASSLAVSAAQASPRVCNLTLSSPGRHIKGVRNGEFIRRASQFSAVPRI
jgi:hypothetical protein